jgi:hypothetical protein
VSNITQGPASACAEGLARSGQRDVVAMLLQQQPIIVELSNQTEASRDISVDTALSIFLMPFVVLLALLLGGAIIGALVVAYKRWRDRGDGPVITSDHPSIRV